MNEHDGQDQRIRDLFQATKRADRSETPRFDVALDAAPARRRFGGRRAFGMTFAGTAATLAVACLAFWLGQQQPIPPHLGAPAPASVPAQAPAPANAPETVLAPPPPPPPPPPRAPSAPTATRPTTPPPVKTERPPSEAGNSGSAAVIVTDGNGAPLPGAVVTISNADGYVKTTSLRADHQGVVKFPVLRPGPNYSVAVSFPIFAPTRRNGVRVESNKTTMLKVQMLDEIKERIKVAADRNILDLEKTAMSTTFSADFLQNLPVPGRLYEEVPVESPARFNTESYRPISENAFLAVLDNPLSTFSIDVDTASYANVRRFLNQGTLPPKDAVRIEELLNYFTYEDPPPVGDEPFSARIEIAGCPWDPAHRLARIGLKGRTVVRGESEGSNLVFLIDVSGSMNDPAKLPLLKAALGLLVDQLEGRDQLSIVVYAGASGLVLPPTSGSAKAEIKAALERLSAGGSTNGASGLRLAYQTAREHFIGGGVNRVILATDGDFNVGVTSQAELLALIEEHARAGIHLTALGFGAGNYKDDTLEHLADRGNGNYAYIDTLTEARKVLVEQVAGTLVTIAKDVKIQIEFNPARVGAYRLIGYENRMLSKEDFNDDRKDAGDIGAGHSVTALYELVPAEAEGAPAATVDPLKYQTPSAPTADAASRELFTLKVRYKAPDGDTSRLLSFSAVDEGGTLASASADLKFSAAVAAFGMILRGSPHTGAFDLDHVRSLAREGLGADTAGYRAGFLELIDRAAVVSRPPAP